MEIKEQKICSKCGKDLPLSEFYKNKGTKDNLTTVCKACHGEQMRKYAADNPEKIKKIRAAAYLKFRYHMGAALDKGELPKKEKQCTQCKRILPYSEYYRAPNTKDGHRTKCKSCLKKQSINYRNENQEKVREHDRNRSRKKKTFSEFLIEKRKEMNFTQMEMANYFGMKSRHSYARFELGLCKSMNNSTIELFAQKLHVKFRVIYNMLELKHEKIINKRFGKLKVIDFYKMENGASFYLCECKCGKEKIVKGNSLVSGLVISCGCVNKVNQQNITNIAKENYTDGTSLAMIKSTKIPVTNTSGTKGVSWNKQKQKWRAYIIFKRVQIELGCYVDLADAIAARKAAEDKYYKPILGENHVKVKGD